MTNYDLRDKIVGMIKLTLGKWNLDSIDTLDYYFGQWSCHKGRPLSKLDITYAILHPLWRRNGIAPDLSIALWLTNREETNKIREDWGGYNKRIACLS